MQYFSTRVSVIAYFYKRAHVTNISSFSWRSKKMPDQACFMAAYGPLSSVDVMMAPAFMSSSEKWVILIENTLPYYHQQMGQFIWFWLEVWIVLVMISTEFMEHTSLLWKHFLDFGLYLPNLDKYKRKR